MFNGIPEHFHQFITSTRTTTSDTTSPHHHHQHHLPPSFPLNNISLPHPTFSNFIDPPHSSLSHHHQQLFQSHLLHQLQQQSSSTTSKDHNHIETKEEEEKEERVVVVDCASNLRVRSVYEMVDPWGKEEVHALLRIRSSVGNGFSDFIWDHVSRKLGELGFKRSAENCKEKFEELNQYCHDNTSYDTKNYRSFSELEALFEDHQNPKTTSLEDDKEISRTDQGEKNMGLTLEKNLGDNETLENSFIVKKQSLVKKQVNTRKRKRQDKLELLKGVCEEIVNKIMIQQEELHKKLLQDMERKEEERVAREEAWKKKEMDRINKEIEIRAQEQAIACDRETKLIEFLKKFSSSSDQNQELVVLKIEDITKTELNPSNTSSSTLLSKDNQNSLTRVPTQTRPRLPTSAKKPISCTKKNPKQPNLSHLDLASENPISLITSNEDVTSSSTEVVVSQDYNPSSISTNDRDQENGKRWPRDEVYSLINLRCNLCSNGGEDKENTKGPLWERISQGMLELGYKRSAKKCKEKWENINKYFRKTKDTNKKRSLDSKTCPYFHQLNSLYNQGRLVLPSEGPENSLGLTENRPESPETNVSGGFSDHQTKFHNANEGEKNNITQASQLEFDY